jgi:hypothetical protein
MEEGYNMTADEYRALLEMTTRYSFEYLQSLTKEELERIYEEKQKE